jgi:coenzyme Q-binding protein COQ10
MPTHADRIVVAYRPQQMFDLVADVGRYPAFLPWCTGANVRSRSEAELVADLTIGFGPFRETFTSRVALQPPTGENGGGQHGRIRARYENGPFRYLNNQWLFIPVPGGTEIDFWVDFEFRNRLLQRAIGVVFSEAVKRMVSAFLKRAQEVYGAPPTDQVSVQTPVAAVTST